MMSQHPQSVTPAFGPRTTPYLSEMAEGLVGSEILKIASDVRSPSATSPPTKKLKSLPPCRRRTTQAEDDWQE